MLEAVAEVGVEQEENNSLNSAQEDNDGNRSDDKEEDNKDNEIFLDQQV